MHIDRLEGEGEDWSPVIVENEDAATAHQWMPRWHQDQETSFLLFVCVLRFL